MGSFEGCGKGYHYVSKMVLFPLTKGKKKAMFISSLTKKKLFVFLHEVFFSQNEIPRPCSQHCSQNYDFVFSIYVPNNYNQQRMP